MLFMYTLQLCSQSSPSLDSPALCVCRVIPRLALILCNQTEAPAPCVCRVLPRPALQLCSQVKTAALCVCRVIPSPPLYSAVRPKLQYSSCAEFSFAGCNTLQSGQNSSTLCLQSYPSRALLLCSQTEAPALCVGRVLRRPALILCSQAEAPALCVCRVLPSLALILCSQAEAPALCVCRVLPRPALILCSQAEAPALNTSPAEKHVKTMAQAT